MATAATLVERSETELRRLEGVPPPQLYDRFSSLARVESDCASAKEGGDLGRLEHEEMMEEFEEAVARIGEGELSEIVDSESGLQATPAPLLRDVRR